MVRSFFSFALYYFCCFLLAWMTLTEHSADKYGRGCLRTDKYGRGCLRTEKYGRGCLRMFEVVDV